MVTGVSAATSTRTQAASPPVHGEQAGARPDAIKIPVGPCRVLIADDEHLIATGISGAVRALGHEVVGIAPDGEAAVQMARQLTPDLALLDIRMPKMTGTEVAAALFRDLSIPSIIISAYSDQDHIDSISGNGSASGVYSYLLKPVSQEELRVAIAVARQRAAVDLHHSGRIHQLEQNLVNRRTVERAKWILVEKHKITEPAAHDRLQRVARDRRKPLLEVAQSVIDTGDLAA